MKAMTNAAGVVLLVALAGCCAHKPHAPTTVDYSDEAELKGIQDLADRQLGLKTG